MKKIESENELLGDYNNDDIIDLLDFNLLKSNFGTTNSAIDIAPAEKGIEIWSEIYSIKIPDGKVDLKDLIVFVNNYGKKKPEEKTVSYLEYLEVLKEEEKIIEQINKNFNEKIDVNIENMVKYIKESELILDVENNNDNLIIYYKNGLVKVINFYSIDEDTGEEKIYIVEEKLENKIIGREIKQEEINIKRGNIEDIEKEYTLEEAIKTEIKNKEILFLLDNEHYGYFQDKYENIKNVIGNSKISGIKHTVLTGNSFTVHNLLFNKGNWEKGIIIYGGHSSLGKNLNTCEEVTQENFEKYSKLKMFDGYIIENGKVIKNDSKLLLNSKIKFKIKEGKINIKEGFFKGTGETYGITYKFIESLKINFSNTIIFAFGCSSYHNGKEQTSSKLAESFKTVYIGYIGSQGSSKAGNHILRIIEIVLEKLYTTNELFGSKDLKNNFKKMMYEHYSEIEFKEPKNNIGFEIPAIDKFELRTNNEKKGIELIWEIDYKDYKQVDGYIIYKTTQENLSEVNYEKRILIENNIEKMYLDLDVETGKKYYYLITPYIKTEVEKQVDEIMKKILKYSKSEVKNIFCNIEEVDILKIKEVKSIYDFKSNIFETEVLINWEQALEVSKVKIYRKLKEEIEYKFITEETILKKYLDKSLDTGKVYNYKIERYNESDELIEKKEYEIETPEYDISKINVLKMDIILPWRVIGYLSMPEDILEKGYIIDTRVLSMNYTTDKVNNQVLKITGENYDYNGEKCYYLEGDRSIVTDKHIIKRVEIYSMRYKRYDIEKNIDYYIQIKNKIYRY